MAGAFPAELASRADSSLGLVWGLGLERFPSYQSIYYIFPLGGGHFPKNVRGPQASFLPSR